MCGIAGYITTTNIPETRNELTRLLRSCAVRGKDASGIATIYKGLLEVYKAPQEAHIFTKTAKYKKTLSHTGTVAIVHTRQATQGATTDNMNNHPIFTKSGLALVHNGVISNDNDIFTKYKLEQDAEVDSEVIVKLIDYYRNRKNNTGKQNTIQQSIRRMASQVRGSMACALISTQEPDTLYLWARTSPLYLIYNKKTHAVLFASTQDIAETLIDRKLVRGFFHVTVNKKNYLIKQVDNHTGLRITPTSLDSFTLPEPEPITYTYSGTWGRWENGIYIQGNPKTKKTKNTTKTQEPKPDTGYNIEQEKKQIALYVHDKAQEARADQYATTPIYKPSKVSLEQLEERIEALENKQAHYCLTYTETQELKRLENCLSDRYASDTPDTIQSASITHSAYNDIYFD